MKTALLIVDKQAQVILTPETQEEKNVIDLMRKEKNCISVLDGSFYPSMCEGGWLRLYQDDQSLILRLTEAQDDKRAS